jgi:hypothetical protein
MRIFAGEMLSPAKQPRNVFCPCAGSGIARNPPMRKPRNRVVQVMRFGGPDDGLEVVDTALPTAGPHEVRVRVLASGIWSTRTC